MATPAVPASPATTTLPVPPENPAVPTFLHTANKAAQIVFAVVLGVIGLGSLGVGITITPFSPEIGMGAIALATALFGGAGLLFAKALSSDMGPRTLAVIN